MPSAAAQHDTLDKQKKQAATINDLPDEILSRILFWIVISDWPVWAYRVKHHTALDKLFKPFSQLRSTSQASHPPLRPNEVKYYDLRLFLASRRINNLATELFYTRSFFIFRQREWSSISQSLSAWQTNNIRRVSLTWQAASTLPLVFSQGKSRFYITSILFIWHPTELKPRCPLACMRALSNLSEMLLVVEWMSAKKGTVIFVPLKEYKDEDGLLVNEVRRQLADQRWAQGWKDMERMDHVRWSDPIEMRIAHHLYPNGDGYNFHRKLDTCASW